MRSIKVDGKILRALNHLTSKDESRFILNGVCIQGGVKGVRAVATDGRRLGVYAVDFKDVEPFEFIIPSDFITMMGSRLTDDVFFSWDDLKVIGPKGWEKPVGGKPTNITVLVLKKCHKTMEIETISGNFPGWKSVLPKDQNWKPFTLTVNWDLLEGFRKCGRVLKPSDPNPILRSTDDRAPISVFLSDANFFGIIMPLVEQGQKTIPDWLHEPVITVPAVPVPQPAATPAVTQPAAVPTPAPGT